MPSAKPLRVASVNVNGVRAAYRKGMGEWLAARDVDILAMQEVRASTEDLPGPARRRVGSRCTTPPRPRGEPVSPSRAAAARASTGSSSAHPTSTAPGAGSRPTTRSATRIVTVVIGVRALGRGRHARSRSRSTGSSMRWSSATAAARRALRARAGRRRPQRRPPHARHQELEGQREAAGFLPDERAYFDRFVGAEGDDDYNAGAGLGWVDVGRRVAGEVPGPYTWWSMRGQGLRHRHRLAHRLPARHRGARRLGRLVHDRPRRRLRPAMVRPRARRRRLRHLSPALPSTPKDSAT